MSWADVIPIVARIDALQARVDALENFTAATISSDAALDDGVARVLINQPLAVGDHMGVCTLSFDLVNPSASPRAVTAWIEAVGPAELAGPRAAQVTLHGALPVGSLTLGPVQVHVTGLANVVVYARADPIGSPSVGDKVVVKASTSTAPIKPGASGFVAR